MSSDLLNRHGEAFNQCETFSGVDYATGLAAAAEFAALPPPPRQTLDAADRLHRDQIREQVHHRW